MGQWITKGDEFDITTEKLNLKQEVAKSVIPGSWNLFKAIYGFV